MAYLVLYTQSPRFLGRGGAMMDQRGDVIRGDDSFRRISRFTMEHPGFRIVHVTDATCEQLPWCFERLPHLAGVVQPIRRHYIDLDALEAIAERNILRKLAADDGISISRAELEDPRLGLKRTRAFDLDPRIVL